MTPGYTVSRPNPRRRVWVITAPDGRVVSTVVDELQALSLAGHMSTLAARRATTTAAIAAASAHRRASIAARRATTEA